MLIEWFSCFINYNVQNTEITLATWNVQTMLKPGKMKEIMEELGKVRVDVVAVQEIR